MAYDEVEKGHTEYGGGPGMIDPEVRKDRALSSAEEVREIYALDNRRDDESPEEVEIPRRPGTRRGDFG